MFLTERLFGVLFYVATLLIVSYLIVRLQSKYTKPLIFFYLICISIMAFLYVPAVEADLYRLTEYMFSYASLPMNEFIALLSETNTPAALLYFRAIGLAGIEGLLAGVTALVVFGNIFYIVYDYSKRLQSSRKAIAFSLLVIMSAGIYMQTISGIRNMLAFSILARCFYDETINGKKIVKNIVWYILACLVHPAAIAAVALRLVALIWHRVRSKQFRSLIIALLSMMFVGYIVLSLGGITYIDNAIFKLELYADEVNYNYLWDNLITVLTLIFILVNYRVYQHYGGSITKGLLAQLIRMSHIITVFSVIFFSEHTIFVRFTQLNLIIMLPIIMSNLSLSAGMQKKSNVDKQVLGKFMLYIPALILVISMTRGSLSSLKFFVLGS